MPKVLVLPASYTKLLKDIRRQIEISRQLVERQMVMTYWNVGRQVAAYQNQARDAGLNGVSLYKQLGRDLGINYRVLYQAVQFAHVYPEPNVNLPLTWSHYRYLCQIDDPAIRARWEKRIVREDIGVHAFQSLLQARRIAQIPSRARSKEPLRGILYHYRLTAVADLHTKKTRLMVDCGFENRIEPPAAGRNLTNKYIYRSAKEGNSYTLKSTSKVNAAQIYTFQASVERVVDADTLLANIDCGFGIYRQERLRLKDIDAPERKTIAGRRALDWVKRELSGCPRVIIKTYNSDKYDRYLADVFYQKGGSVPGQVAARGLCLNDELLRRGLAKIWL